MLVAMSPASNPYSPPKHEHAAPVVTAEVTALEAHRRGHLNAETNIKTIGFLLYIGAFACITTGLPRLTIDLVDGMILVATGSGLGFAGYLLRRLDPRGRTLYTVIAAIQIVVVLATDTDNAPGYLGQLFWVVLMVALLWWGKASVVMAPHYREVVVPATPHIKYKTSPLLVVLGVVLLGILILLLLSPLY
jgi:hypothetical protein